MAHRKFKLIYLSHDLTKKVELTLTHRKVRAALLALVVFFLVTNVVAGLFASFLLNSRDNQALQRENQRLRSHVTAIEERMAQFTQHLMDLNETDKHLRMVADLPALDEDVLEVGVGGTSGEVPLGAKLAELSFDYLTLGKIARGIELQVASFEEIEQKLTANADLLEHTPTIRPLEGGYVSSGFGMRRDPFTKRLAHHEGIDFSHERGTPIVATAAGQVIFSGRYFSYGKFIVVDHGFGYQTAYGHLLSMDVRVGQYVTKGQSIGTVGSTGRSTGNHLHYEVRVNGRPVNPMDYFFEEPNLERLAAKIR